MNFFFFFVLPIAKSLGFCLVPCLSLVWRNLFPWWLSAASNALTSASHLRAALVIRQDSYLSGSPTASAPLSSPPSYFLSHPLSFLPQHHFLSFWSCSPAVSSVSLFFFCLIITSELYSISFATFHDGPIWNIIQLPLGPCRIYAQV